MELRTEEVEELEGDLLWEILIGLKALARYFSTSSVPK